MKGTGERNMQDTNELFHVEHIDYQVLQKTDYQRISDGLIKLYGKGGARALCLRHMSTGPLGPFYTRVYLTMEVV